MTELDPATFEQRYRELEAELGQFNVGEAIRYCLGLPVADEGWDRVVAAEVRRCVDLHRQHYQEHEGPTVVTVGGGKITHSHDELMASIGFLQGVTFAVAAAQARA